MSHALRRGYNPDVVLECFSSEDHGVDKTVPKVTGQPHLSDGLLALERPVLDVGSKVPVNQDGSGCKILNVLA